MEGLPFHMGYLTDEMIVKAEEELGETPELRKEAIIKLRKLVHDEPKFYCPDDDAYLLQFLRARKFDVRRAFSLIQGYYQAKKSYHDIYGKPDWDGFMKNMTDHVIHILPYRDKDGCVVLILRLDMWDVDGMNFGAFEHALTAALVGYMTTDPATQVCGLKAIVDVRGASFKHIRHVTPRQLSLIARGLMNGVPIRFKGIHVVNVSTIFYYFYNVIRVLLTDKIKKRIFLHSRNLEDLRTHFDPKLLPEYYGGHLKCDNSFFIQKAKEDQNIYYALHTYGYKSRKNSMQEDKLCTALKNTELRT